MVDQLTIGGIPIPSNAPLFLGVLFVHVAAGLTSVGAGAVAAMSAKRAPRHPRVGAVYFWALVVAVLSMFILSVSRWSEDRILVVIGVASLAAALIARSSIRRYGRAKLKRHILGMGTSYTLMLVAFYVDNGAHLPLWRNLPTATYWGFPMAIGALLTGLAVYRHSGEQSSPQSPRR